MTLNFRSTFGLLAGLLGVLGGQLGCTSSKFETVPGAQSVQNADDLVGIYRNQSTIAEAPPYFIVTASKEFYTLSQKDLRWFRRPRGNLLKLQFTFNDGVLKTGEVVASKTGVESLDSFLNLLGRLNDSVLKLDQKLRSMDRSADLNLLRDFPSFSEDQLEMVNAWRESPQTLLSLMDFLNSGKFEVGDYRSPDLYLFEGRLYLPVGVRDPSERMIQKINNEGVNSVTVVEGVPLQPDIEPILNVNL